MRWRRSQLFTLVALHYFCCLKNHLEIGFTKNHFADKVIKALKNKSDPLLLRLRESLCPPSKNEVKETVISKRLVMDNLELLETDGHVETVAMEPHKLIRITELGITTAQLIYKLLEIDSSPYETTLKNLTWDIYLKPASKKLNQKYGEKMFVMEAHVQKEEHRLGNLEPTFIFTNDDKIFESRFGKDEFVWGTAVKEVNPNWFRVWDYMIKTFDGKEFQLEGHNEIEEGTVKTKFTHPQLGSQAGRPVLKSYKFQVLLREYTRNILVKLNHPTRKLRITLNFGDADILRAICMEEFLSEKAVVEYNEQEKKVSVSTDDTEIILPPRGVGFAFIGKTRKRETNAKKRRSRKQGLT